MKSKLKLQLSGKIPDTAFLVNESRARSTRISSDKYSELWIPLDQRKPVKNLWRRFSAEVYPCDDIEVGVRTAFFLKALREFMADNPKGVFINIGSGFTSYQYLLPKGFKTIEIDLPSIIAFRRQRAEILVQLGKLPFRHTEYFSLDLAKKDSRLTLYELLARTTEIPSFILMEGLTYYLPDSVVDNLCFLFCSRQRPGSILAFDYWLNTIRGSSVFNRLCSFYLREFNFARRRFNLFTARRIEQLYGYETIAQSDVYHQEPLFSAKPILTRSPLTLPENYAVLRRTHSSQLSR